MYFRDVNGLQYPAFLVGLEGRESFDLLVSAVIKAISEVAKDLVEIWPALEVEGRAQRISDFGGSFNVELRNDTCGSIRVTIRSCLGWEPVVLMSFIYEKMEDVLDATGSESADSIHELISPGLISEDTVYQITDQGYLVPSIPR